MVKKFLAIAFACLLGAALSIAPARAQVTVDSSGGCHTLAGGQIPCGVGILPIPVGNGNPLLGTPTTGSFAISGTSGVMAAGLASASPIVSFRYTGTGICVIRRVILSAADAGTAFAAGVATFTLSDARAFTASDTGGTAQTLTTNNGKLRTSLATTAVGDFRIASTATLSAGTRTLDATPLTSNTVGVAATAGIGLVGAGTNLFLADVSQEPIVLANNEGVVIQATVPATGTWTFSVTVLYDETPSF